MPEIQEILLLHHSHLDVGYTHSQPILWALQEEYLTQVLDWLEETADQLEGSRPKWTCEATEPVLRWLSSASHDQKGRFRHLVNEGRIGLTALRWHITPLANRAGLIRLLDGKRELEDQMGVTIPVACQHDVTGIPWPLSDVLLDAGVDFLVMAINIHLGRAVEPRPGLFLWETPSGRTIRVWNGHHYTMFDQLLNSWHDSVDRMEEGWKAYEQRLASLRYPMDFVYLTTTCSPVMWDNAPNNPFLPDLIHRWNESNRGPRIRYATMDDLRQRAAMIPDSDLQTIRGDWTDYWNFGCASSPISTARSQAAKPLIEAAEILGAQSGNIHPAVSLAKDRIDSYDEHTFGYFDSTASHPQAQTTELLKQAMAHEGHEYAAFALMDGLEKLAKNPSYDRGITGALFCNTGNRPLVIQPLLPASWFENNERAYRASRMFFDGRSWDSGFPGAEARTFAPETIPPFSWRVIPLTDLVPAPVDSGLNHTIDEEATGGRELNFAPASNHRKREGRIESPYFRLRYNPESGRILSLYNKEMEKELLAPRDGYDCFSFVRERTDALSEGRRYAFYRRDLDREKIDEMCWQDWNPIREGATRVTRLIVRESVSCITLERELEAPGLMRLVQKFRLFAHDPVIRIEVELELLPDGSPQSIYFVLPLNLCADWEAAFDTAGIQVRLDEDQLFGACRNWATVEILAMMKDKFGGIALFSHEAPLVQFGDFNFGRPKDSIKRPAKPLLVSWPVNNYWDTNFPRIQPGLIRLSYGLASFGVDTTFSELQALAQAFRQPELIWPVTTKGRGKGQGDLNQTH